MLITSLLINKFIELTAVKFNVVCILTTCLHINLCININQLDALNFIISLFQASACFEHMCLSSGGQNCVIVSGIITPIGMMIPETV